MHIHYYFLIDQRISYRKSKKERPIKKTGSNSLLNWACGLTAVTKVTNGDNAWPLVQDKRELCAVRNVFELEHWRHNRP